MSQPKPKVLILGAASGIAEATARIYASEGAGLVLAGRKRERLEQIAVDLRLRGAGEVSIVEIDFATPDVKKAWPDLLAAHGDVDHVLHAYGVLGDNAAAEHDPAAAQTIIAANFSSAAAWALLAADYFERRGQGSLVILGSIAGDRGRRADYIYGAGKSGIATLVQVIAHRFADKGPRAVIVKPGPTDTAMTAGIKKGGPLWARPEDVAAVVRRAADKGGPVQYAPARWRLIMLVIRNLPSAIMNRLNI